jgi:two-component system response regulator HydG
MSAASGIRLLVVDDEAIVRESLKDWLGEDGHAVDVVESGRAALEAARAAGYSAILLDIRMPGMDGMETLRELRRLVPSVPVVMMTAYADVSTAVAAMKAGAVDYVTKPFDPDEISSVIGQYLHGAGRVGLEASLEPGSETWSYDDFVGRSASMARVIDLARKAATASVPVLLRGERGLGKECLARAIWAAGSRSARRAGPFVPVYCGGLTPAVLEAELLGYEQGASPSSPLAKKGRIELADQGTLYLDEVSGLSERLQLVLLHAIVDRKVVRLGGETPRLADFRPLAATSNDLEARVREGQFLAELHEELSRVVIEIPPLRERPEDIPSLVERLIERKRREVGKAVSGCLPEALELLTHQPWPGNLRQLQRVIERAMVACPGEVIRPQDLPIA